jgi:tetratricopeptide (TPR) repeat protein
MQLVQLEDFDKAIRFTANGDKEAAEPIFRRLCATNPTNPRLFICLAYACAELDDARQALDTAQGIDPDALELATAWRWLSEQEEKDREYRQRVFTHVHPTPAPQPVISGADSSNYSDDAEINRLINPPPARRPWRRAEKIWLALMVLSAALLIFALVRLWQSSNEVSEAERGYLQNVGDFTALLSAIESNRRELDPTEPSEQGRYLGELQKLVELNRDFRQARTRIKPPPRFEALDSQLSLAFNYFGEGANELITGLRENDPDALDSGNRLLENGNRALETVRAELKRLKL